MNSLSSGTAALLGAIVGALASTLTQTLLSILARRRQLADSRLDAAAGLVACAEAIATEYRMLAYSLDHAKPETAKLLFERGLVAWSSFQQARARVGVTCSTEMNDAAREVYSALNGWVDEVDLYYFEEGAPADHLAQEDKAKAAIEKLALLASQEPKGRLVRRLTREKRRWLRLEGRTVSEEQTG